MKAFATALVSLSIVGLSTVLSSAAMAYTTCSDSSGNVRYIDADYEGGPAPMPGMIMDDIQVLLNSVLVSESKQPYQMPFIKGPVTVTFDDKSKHLFLDDHTNFGAHAVYGQLVTLSGSIKQAQLPISVYVICDYSFSPKP